MRRSAALRATALEDRTTPSASMLDFVGPIQMREDLLAQVMNCERFSGPVQPPDSRSLTNPVEPPDRLPNFSPLPTLPPPEFDWIIMNPVMPPDWKLNLEPVRMLSINPIGDPAILPPHVPLIPPYNVKPIGDPAILPPNIPLIPPYDVKPIGDPIILPPVVPLTDSIDNTVILDPPYGPYYPFPPTPCADPSSGPNGATIHSPG